MKSLLLNRPRNTTLNGAASSSTAIYSQSSFAPVSEPKGGLSMNNQEKTLHIDIPVELKEVKNVFSVASLSFEGDLPAAAFHLQLIANDVSDWKAKSEV